MNNIKYFLGLTGLMDEFIRLAKTDKKDKFMEANRNINQAKNRYKNVYPYDDTRVRLSQRPGIEGSDYINANFIDSYACKNYFIATQAPLEATIGDFWRMIWEQKCGTIVMLSKEVESSQVGSLKITCIYQYYDISSYMFSIIVFLSSCLHWSQLVLLVQVAWNGN